jgi:hypothetical protein
VAKVLAKYGVVESSKLFVTDRGKWGDHRRVC